MKSLFKKVFCFLIIFFLFVFGVDFMNVKRRAEFLVVVVTEYRKIHGDFPSGEKFPLKSYNPDANCDFWGENIGWGNCYYTKYTKSDGCALMVFGIFFRADYDSDNGVIKFQAPYSAFD